MSYRIGFGVEFGSADFVVPRDGTIDDAVHRFWANGPIKLFVGADTALLEQFLDHEQVIIDPERVWGVYRLAGKGTAVIVAHPADEEAVRAALRAASPGGP